jgi:hypothetical protein
VSINQSDTFAIELKVNDGSVTFVNDSTYIVRPINTEGEIKLKLYYKNLPVEIANCTITEIPAPKLLYKAKEVESVRIGDLANFLRDFNLEFENGVEPDYKSIYAYTYSYISKEGRNFTGRIYLANKYTKEAENFAKNAASGGMLTINTLQIMCEGNRVKNVNFEKDFNIID